MARLKRPVTPDPGRDESVDLPAHEGPRPPADDVDANRRWLAIRRARQQRELAAGLDPRRLLETPETEVTTWEK
jgi:hypothetical protein